MTTIHTLIDQLFWFKSSKLPDLVPIGILPRCNWVNQDYVKEIPLSVSFSYKVDEYYFW